jgi:hypothetical protein
MKDEEWTSYAPLGGYPDAHCFICGTGQRDLPERQWAFSDGLAICGQCVKRLAVTFARQEEKSLDEWIADRDWV